MTSRNLQNCFEYEYQTENMEDNEAHAEACVSGRNNDYLLSATRVSYQEK